MQFRFEPMTAHYAQQMVTWRYHPPYDLYNPTATDPAADIQALVDPANAYFALLNEHDLIGFRCFGADAQVVGGAYTDDALDTGGGLRPDLTGQGLGGSVLRAGLALGRQLFKPPAFRVTVAAFNERALRMCRLVGFEAVQQFERPSDRRPFLMLVRNEQGEFHGDQA